jgi:hypothetical protein
MTPAAFLKCPKLSGSVIPSRCDIVAGCGGKVDHDAQSEATARADCVGRLRYGSAESPFEILHSPTFKASPRSQHLLQIRGREGTRR